MAHKKQTTMRNRKTPEREPKAKVASSTSAATSSKGEVQIISNAKPTLPTRKMPKRRAIPITLATTRSRRIKKFRFLELPPELRISIYEYAGSGMTTHVSKFKQSDLTCRSPLARVSPQTRREMLHEMFGHSKLVVATIINFDFTKVINFLQNHLTDAELWTLSAVNENPSKRKLVLRLRFTRRPPHNLSLLWDWLHVIENFMNAGKEIHTVYSVTDPFIVSGSHKNGGKIHRWLLALGEEFIHFEDNHAEFEGMTVSMALNDSLENPIA